MWAVAGVGFVPMSPPSGRAFTVPLCAGVSLAAMCLHYAVVSLGVNEPAPRPYMDELFHADQLAAYCGGNFTYWNGKITTPPGLYLVTLPLVRLSSSFVGWPVAQYCEHVVNLRLLNGFWLGLLVSVLFWTLANQDTGHCAQGGKAAGHTLALSAFAIAHMPVLWQTSWLYYTDLPCAVFLVLGYALCERRAYSLSSLSLLATCLLRQSAVVWLLFCFGLAVRDAFATTMRRGDDDLQLVKAVLDIAKWSPAKLRQLLKALAANCAPYSLAIAAFVCAVVCNGGLALGDKSAHQAVLHLVQVHYCTLFILVMGAPLLLHPRYVYQSLFASPPRLRQLSLLALFLLTTLVSVRYFTLVHPYLLADNRHYTFYIWRRWFARHYACKYLLIPVYAVGCILIGHSLRHRTAIWRAGFAVAWVLAAAPNKLLEFRYFIPAYLLWRISAQPLVDRYNPHVTVALECCLFAAVNGGTLWLFANKPFEWPSEPGVQQRFIW